MPLQPEGSAVRLVGAVTVEEVEPLVEWLRTTEDPSADLSECTALHTAAIQTLMVAAPRITAWPTDPFLAAHLPDLLAVNPEGTPS